MNQLKEIRRSKGISQYELGRQIGSYQTKIWLIEQGYYKPKEKEKKAIAEVLAVDVEDIFPED